MKQLLTDNLPLVFTLNESETVNGVRKLRGLFHLAETKNANGRIYPKALLEREIKRIMPAINERSVLGAISHPIQPQIDLASSSHVITKLKLDGNQVFGELETLRTPNGKILEGLIESNVKLGISSRGLGSLRESDDGTKYVQDDYGLITWDVVPNPSTPEAWLGESQQTPIIINVSHRKLVEFGNDNKVFENTSKINIESVTKRLNDIFGGK